MGLEGILNMNELSTFPKDHKPAVTLPPPYSNSVHDHKSSSRKSGSSPFKIITPNRLALEVPIQQPLMMDKMIHLESLCSSMQTMMEFQTHAYNDVKNHLIEISQAVNPLERPGLVPKVSEELTEPLSQDSPSLQLGSSDVIKYITEEAYEVDTGYDRVCSMLDHLLDDAQTAIETQPPLMVNYSAEQDEELISSASLITPLRQKLTEDDRDKEKDSESKLEQLESPMPKATPIRRNITEVKFWCQVITNGQVQEPYQIQRKLALPNIVPYKNNITVTTDSSNRQTAPKPSGVVSIYSHSKIIMAMIYWTVLFALGVFLLDRYLIELASGQVANTMGEIGTDIQKEFTELSEEELEYEASQKIECFSERPKKKVSSCYRRSRRNSM